MNYRSLLKLFIGVMILMAGASLCAKLDLGVAAYDSFVLNGSISFNITYGTFNIIVGFLLVLCQFVILRKVQLKSFSQMIMLFGASFCYDIFYYIIFKNVMIESLYLRMAIFILTDIMMALGIAIMTTIEFESFPLETMMKIIGDKFKLNMGIIKYIVDGVWLVLSLSIGIIFKMSNMHIGLGTLFLLATQGLLIGYFHGKVKNFLS